MKLKSHVVFHHNTGSKKSKFLTSKDANLIWCLRCGVTQEVVFHKTRGIDSEMARVAFAIYLMVLFIVFSSIRAFYWCI